MEHQRIQFKNDMFGKITPLECGKFAPPTVYPKKNEHPRVLFTKKSLEVIRRNLTAAENKSAYEKYISRSQTETTGILQSCDDGKTPNMINEILAIIEACVFG